jgi:outer membrane protein TolC
MARRVNGVGRISIRKSIYCAAFLLACGENLGAQAAPDNLAPLSVLEAARSALVKSPQLHLQEQQVELNRGIKQQASGQFDLLLSGGYQQGYTNNPLTALQRLTALESGIVSNNQGTNAATFTFNAPELFRNGIQAGPSIESTRIFDNLSDYTGTNRTVSDFNLSIPLLRNRGREVVAAQETAAGLQINASLFDLRQTITDLLAAVASDYWQYVAALANLQVARGSEERGRTIKENLEELIAADRLPRAEIYETNANLADRIANRIAAEQQVAQAQQQLALAMGLGANEITMVGLPSDDFPPGEILPAPGTDRAVIQRFIDEALRHRADVKGDQTRIAAAQVQQVAARNQLKPLVNLTFAAGASGLDEGKFFVHLLDSPVHGVKGLDLTGGVTFSIDRANNTAKGQVVQANATIRQAQLQLADAERTIASTVAVSVLGLRNAQAELVEARRSVDAFQQSLELQREKIRLGLVSVVDILTVEDRLTTALTTQVQAKLNYSLALAQLRQATGTFVDANQTSVAIDRDVFFTVPFGGRP